MTKSGFTDLAVSLSARSLQKQGLIEKRTLDDERGDFEAFVVTDAGFTWLETHRSELALSKRVERADDKLDDIPF
jgi:predicted transcriptional regulator